MNRVTKRTWVVALFTLVLVCGMAFFLGEYWLHAPQWVAAPGSPHVYANRNLSRGAVADRKGTVLLDLSDGRSYSDSAATRKSTLHWLGDRNGAISASAVSHYAGALVGYDRINGIYHAQEKEGVITLTLSEQVQNGGGVQLPHRRDPLRLNYAHL